MQEKLINAGLWVVVLAVLGGAFLGYAHWARTSPSPKQIQSVIDVTMRESSLGNGAVLVVHNFASGPLSVAISTYNLDSHQSGIKVAELADGETFEYGWMEGWKFEPNERVHFASRDYEPASLLTRRGADGKLGFDWDWVARER